MALWRCQPKQQKPASLQVFKCNALLGCCCCVYHDRAVLIHICISVHVYKWKAMNPMSNSVAG